LTLPLEVKNTIGALCSVRRRNPGKITMYIREQYVKDEAEATRIRTARKKAHLEKKARAQANKMATYDSAIETRYAQSQEELETEIRSYGKARGHLLHYLQEQFKGRKLLREGIYTTIPTVSKFRSHAKPYKLRMLPPPNAQQRITTQDQIVYLRELLSLMIAEDQGRTLQPTLQPEDTKLVRALPVISDSFVNPLSVRLKKEQEAYVRAMASPTDNPWLVKLQDEYVGKILYDGGYYRVVIVQFVANKNSNRYPCWEATTEPVYKAGNGTFIVHDRHFAIGPDGSRTILKSSLVGFALAEYSNGTFSKP
jgi:hypothetical protein